MFSRCFYKTGVFQISSRRLTDVRWFLSVGRCSFVCSAPLALVGGFRQILLYFANQCTRKKKLNWWKQTNDAPCVCHCKIHSSFLLLLFTRRPRADNSIPFATYQTWLKILTQICQLLCLFMLCIPIVLQATATYWYGKVMFAHARAECWPFICSPMCSSATFVDRCRRCKAIKSKAKQRHSWISYFFGISLCVHSQTVTVFLIMAFKSSSPS